MADVRSWRGCAELRLSFKSNTRRCVAAVLEWELRFLCFIFFTSLNYVFVFLFFTILIFALFVCLFFCFLFFFFLGVCWCACALRSFFEKKCCCGCYVCPGALTRAHRPQKIEQASQQNPNRSCQSVSEPPPNAYPQLLPTRKYTQTLTKADIDTQDRWKITQTGNVDTGRRTD